MSVLDYLLPKSFMSDVQTTFRPKSFNRLEAGEFTPGYSDRSQYESYLDMLDQDMNLTTEAYKFFSAENKEERNRLAQEAAEAAGMVAPQNFKSTDYMEALFNPSHPLFGFADKESLQPNVNIFGGQSLSEGFERAGVYDFDPAMAKPMELSTLRAIDPGSYAKEVAMKRGTLADVLARQRAKTSQVGGGFAGYGGRTVAEGLAEQQFAEGSQAIMEDVNKQRANALQQLYSELENYGSIIEPMNM